LVAIGRPLGLAMGLKTFQQANTRAAGIAVGVIRMANRAS